MIIFGLVPAIARAGQAGAHVEYVGGTRPEIPTNEKGNLQAADEQYLVFYAKHASIRVAYERINLLEYGQKVDRRYALAVFVSPVFALSKKRQHFLTVGYIDDKGREQAVVFRVEKEDIRAILVVLEARTGRKVEFQDEEARKAGRG
jgi:hypothetical protein